MLAVHAATGPGMVEDLARVVAAEFADIVESGPSVPELQRAKAQLKAGLLMALESSSVRAEQMARHLMAHGRFVPVAELMDKVNEVNAKSVQELAARILKTKPSIALVGSGRRSAKQAKTAAAALTAEAAAKAAARA